ncbi:MAG: M23 family metallopeptidase [Desulfobulbaceae bacterium]|nr:M23 family metallopeptidase [Desulfobulbaceae bacterium]MCK5436511.1 M23 family metallopeptidase [Desulfobulbaceae bacterium]
MNLDKIDNRTIKSKGSALAVVAIFMAVIAILAIGALILLCERERPEFTLLSDVSQIGLEKEIVFSATDRKRGLRKIQLFIVQGDKHLKIYQKEFPDQDSLLHPGPGHAEESLSVDAKALGLRQGQATLVADVWDFSMWNWAKGNKTTLTYPMNIDTHPPRVTIIDSPTYIKAGGSAIVTYKVNEPTEKHGVMVNGHFHPGHPLKEGVFIAYIGIPFDTSKIEKAYVSATDRAENTGHDAFGMIVRKIRIIPDRINVSDNFLNLKLPEFRQRYPDLAGEPIEQYLYLNEQIRKENNELLSGVCVNSEPDRLWQGVFKRMARSSTRAGYPDHRTYYYKGKKIDNQVHLGIDLASVRHAEVKAANSGVVVFTDYVGLYGQTVILDHGQGVFSLYSHLSRINVVPGDTVDSKSVIGLTGNTGMALGDHLHFSMLVNGIFVNPLEWWDPNWLKLNILNLL